MGTETKRVSFRNLAIGQFSDSVLVLGSNHEIRLLFGKNNFERFFSVRVLFEKFTNGYLFHITRKIMRILITEVDESRAKMIYLNLFYLP